MAHRQQARADPGPVTLGDRLEHGGQPGEPGEVPVGVRAVGDPDPRQHDEQLGGGGEEGVGDRVLHRAGVEVFQQPAGLVDHHVPVQPVTVVQGLGVERPRPVEDGLETTALVLVTGDPVVGEPVVPVP